MGVLNCNPWVLLVVRISPAQGGKLLRELRVEDTSNNYPANDEKKQKGAASNLKNGTKCLCSVLGLIRLALIRN